MKLEEEVTLRVKNCSQACRQLNQNIQTVVQQQNPLYQASASRFSDPQVRFLNRMVQTVEVRLPTQNRKGAPSQRLITMATAAKSGKQNCIMGI